jgi:hypothetical protein
LGPQRPVPAPPEIFEGARDCLRIGADDASERQDARQRSVSRDAAAFKPRRDPFHRLVADHD